MERQTHYETLSISPEASAGEIKQAYRRLVKLFHPDSQRSTASHDRIADINVAYEVLSDPERRRFYDRRLREQEGMRGRYPSGDAPEATRDEQVRQRQRRTEEAQGRHRRHHRTGQDADDQLHLWLNYVYQPVSRLLNQILKPLQEQIDDLAADPFDDELVDDFLAYLDDCRDRLNNAQARFRSMPNPPSVASAAAHLYYCMDQVGDGIEELERFTSSYDDHYLHTGQELFRIAKGLRREAQAAINAIA